MKIVTSYELRVKSCGRDLTTPSACGRHPFKKLKGNVFLLLSAFYFLLTGVFAQTDFFYGMNGEKAYLKIKKDMALLKCQPETKTETLLAQSFFTSAFHVQENLFIANLDTLRMNLQQAKKTPNIEDVTYALESKDGTILFPTYDIVVQMKEGRKIEEMLDKTGFSPKINTIILINKYLNAYVVNLKVALGDILQISRNLYETGECNAASPSFIAKMRLNDALHPESNPLYPMQWGLHNTGQIVKGVEGVPGTDINVEPAWQITKGDPNIKVAVLDVGIKLNHPDLEANLLQGYDATTGALGGANGSCLEYDHHGTCCAGVIGAADNNEDIVGVAPNCKIIPIRIGYSNNNSKGIPPEPDVLITNDVWAADGVRKAWKTFGADVISCSWGSIDPSFPQTYAAIDSAIREGRGGKGCVVVASAGNADPDYGVSYPAKLPGVIAVGNIQNNGGRYITSSFHDNALNVVAPGTNICTTTNDSCAYATGTSFACPHVSGIAALVLSANPCLTQKEVKMAIELSCMKETYGFINDNFYDECYIYSYFPLHENGSWNNEMGHGLVDAYKAVMYALAQPQTFYNVSGIETGEVSEELYLNISNDWGLTKPNWAPGPVSSGYYKAKRHEIRATIPYNYTVYPVIEGVANGLSNETQYNNGRYFMDKQSVSQTEATVRTYVYEIIQTLGGVKYDWIPVSPDKVRFNVFVTCDNLQYKLFLQNESENAAITYNAITGIEAGKNVNPDEPTGDYVILTGANVDLHAGESVVLSDGFTANFGSHFRAFIEPYFNCVFAAEVAEKGNNEPISVITRYSVEKTEFPDLKEKVEENGLYLKLYPNPSTGNVTIEYNLSHSESVEITITDNFGKPVYKLKNRTPHDAGVYKILLTGVELPAGIYYCTLRTEKTQITEKLMLVGF